MAIWTKYSQTMDTSNTYIKYRLKVVLNSQSIENNTSNITVSVQVWRTNTGYTTYGTGTCYATINGAGYTQSITSAQTITYNSYTELFTRTLNIVHDYNGSKTLQLSSYINHSQFTSSNQAWSGGCVLDTIPRASGLAINNSGLDLGTALTMTIDPKDVDFTHKFYSDWYDGYWTQIYPTNTSGNNYSYTTPLSWCNDRPNSTTGNGRIKLETYNGATKVGETIVSFNATVPIGIVPTCGLDCTINNLFGIFAFKTIASAYLEITNPAGSYGSTIVGYHIEGDGINVTTINGTTTVFTTAGYKTYNAYVIDSRGRTSDVASQSFNVEDYYLPTINLFTCRVLFDNTRNDITGTYIYISATYTMITDFGNDIEVNKVYINDIEVADGSSYVDKIIIDSFGGYTTATSHTVKFEFKDSIGQLQTLTYVIAPGAVPIVVAPNRRGIGFGGYEDLDEDDVLKSHWKYKGTDIELTGDVTINKAVNNNVISASTDSSYSDYYFKMGEVTLTYQYDEAYFNVDVAVIGNLLICGLKLSLVTRQNATMGNIPILIFKRTGQYATSTGIKFYAVASSLTVQATIIEIYAQINGSYNNCHLMPQSQLGGVEYFSDIAPVASLPTGTQWEASSLVS